MNISYFVSQRTHLGDGNGLNRLRERHGACGNVVFGGSKVLMAAAAADAAIVEYDTACQDSRQLEQLLARSPSRS